MIANLEVIQSNIYILDVLISQGHNASSGSTIYDEGYHLSKAAENLKTRMLAAYNKDVDSLSDLFLSYSYMMPVASEGFGEAVHMMIAKSSIPGLIAELIRTLGNILLNIGDMAKEFTKLYAISAAASVLSNHYLTYLNAGNGIKTDDYWLFYSDNGETAVKYLMNLFVIRITGEQQMIDTDEANSFLIEWLYKYILFNAADCQRNIDECLCRLSKY